MLRNLVRLGLQVLERQKILEDSGDDTAFSFHSIDNGHPGTSAKQEKKKKKQDYTCILERLNLWWDLRVKGKGAG